MLRNIKVWRAVYDDPPAGDPPVTPPPAGDPPAPQTLADYLKTTPGAQDELNKMMADNRKKLTTQNQELMSQLTAIKDQFSGTAQQKEELEAQIEQLNNQFLTKEELAKREQEKAKKEHIKALEKATADAESWKNRYTQSTISRELLDAAIGAKAINADVIVDMLGGKTHLAPVLVDGQQTGNYEVRVNFADSDEDGNAVNLDLTPDATLKRMSELTDKYGHLFQSTATGGMGANSSRGGDGKPPVALSAILEDPVAYAEWRKKNPDLDISKLRK
jgi:hypothetical protein